MLSNALPAVANGHRLGNWQPEVRTSYFGKCAESNSLREGGRIVGSV
jgi:hypothetical protein